MKAVDVLEAQNDLDPHIKSRIKSWLEGAFDESTKLQIEEMLKSNKKELIDAFYTTLAFGTGGLRGVMGPGCNRMNQYTVRGATKGLANYLLKQFPYTDCRVVIGYDSRNNSRYFAEESAKVLAANGIKVFLFKELRPTPLISFACRYQKCHAAIMVTASHNPPQYNGYKVYWQDGGQVLPPHDNGIINEVSRITDLSRIEHVPSIEHPLIKWIGEEIDEAYLLSIEQLQLHPLENQKQGKNLKILYSSLHGTGITLVPKALEQSGFSTVSFVQKQIVPDGNFPGTPYPNPEEKEAMSLGMQELMEKQLDIFMATDPDADRLGVVVLHQGNPIMLTGNQVACLCADYVSRALNEKGELSSQSMFVKSIVTSELFRQIVEAQGACCTDVLIGFKYIAEKIREWESDGSGRQFIFGGEESLGYLLGTHSRDKDAVVSSCLVAEMALHAKSQGKTLVDCLHDIYCKHGVYLEKLLSIKFPETMQGRQSIMDIMKRLRQDPPDQLVGSPIVKINDYLSGWSVNIKDQTKNHLHLSATDMLSYELQDGSLLIIRPSGTEPKIKIYLMIKELVHPADNKEDRQKPIEKALYKAQDKLEKFRLEANALFNIPS